MLRFRFHYRFFSIVVESIILIEFMYVCAAHAHVINVILHLTDSIIVESEAK